jgi:hypothetical protein
MKLKPSPRRLAVLLSIITVAGLLALFLQWESPPIHVGSRVDDVWTYIHTNAVSDGLAGRILPINKSTRWIADATTIHSETRFNWHKRPFATQKTVYSYTNGAVTGADSDWQMQWPF